MKGIGDWENMTKKQIKDRIEFLRTSTQTIDLRNIGKKSMTLLVNGYPAIGDQYNDQRWFDLRDRILKRDHHTCQKCGSKGPILQVHHKKYAVSCLIWDVPDEWLVTWCKPCHEKHHEWKGVFNVVEDPPFEHEP